MTIQTIEAVLMPDGSIRLSKRLQAKQPQRVLVTLLDEPARLLEPETGVSERDRVEAILIAAGLMQPREAPALSGLLADNERAALAQRIAQAGGKPLSDTILEDRQERW
jgi:hypothetical protein